MLKLLPLASVLLPLFLNAQSGPGGIGNTYGNSHISLWLSADDIQDTAYAPVDSWMDRSGYNNHAYTLNNPPVLLDSITGNQPAVVFNANSENALKIAHNDVFNSNYISVFVVGHMNDSADSKASFLVKATENTMTSGFGLLRQNSIEKLRFYTGNYTDNRDSEPFTYGISDLFVGNYRTGNTQDQITTLVNNAGDGTSSFSPYIPNNAPLIIGARANNNGGTKSYLDGAISEIIVVNEDLPSVQRIIISNYLAAKYQMPISTQKYSYFNTHPNQLIGIGKYKDVAHSKSSEGVLTIEESTSHPLQNSEFLMVAHNGGSGLPVNTTDLIQFSQQLDRTWRAHVNGTINGENLRFNLTNINAPRTPGEYHLILDLDGDEDYSNATIIPASYYDAATNDMVFENVNLITGSVFTMAFSKTITWDGTHYENGSGPNQEPTDLDYHRTLLVYGADAHISGGAQVRNVVNTVNGELTIDSSICFTVITDIVNEGNFTVEENASLIQLSTGKNNNSGNGSYTVKRTGLNSANGINDWSSPVAHQHLITLFNNTNQCDILTYSSLVQNWKHDYPNNFQGNCLGNSVVFPASSNILYGDGYMNVGRGYFVPGSAINPQKLFTGTINNGDYDILLTATDIGNNPNWNDDDWNFVGNPYPSALNPFAFWYENAVNNNKITDALYFWDDLGTAGSEYDQYNDYSSWNLTGGIASDNSSKIVSQLNHIASGQGFFVWADTLDSWDSAGVYLSTLTFNNRMRSCLNSQFFKSENQPEKELVWLSLTSPSGDMVKTLVGMVEGATDAKDRSYDARKPPHQPALSLASTVGTDTTGYVIQGVAFTNVLQSEKKVNLKVSINQTGLYTIERGAFEKTTPNTTVYLEDTYLNVMHPIENTPYTVQLNQIGTNFDRFNVVFKTTVTAHEDQNSNPITTNVTEVNQQRLSIYTSGDQLVISSKDFIDGSVVIFDIMGRELAKKTVINQHLVNLDFNLPEGTYIVRYNGTDGKSVTKKLVRY